MGLFQKLSVAVALSVLVAFGPTLAQNNATVQIATGNTSPWTGETLPHHGFVNHVITEAFKREGYTVKFDYFPWKRSYEQVKDGNFHATSYWYKSSERENSFYYSDPISTERIVFFHPNLSKIGKF